MSARSPKQFLAYTQNDLEFVIPGTEVENFYPQAPH